MNPVPTHPARPEPPAPPRWLALVEQRARSLRFGTIVVTVHEGRVTQVEVTERTRIDPTATQRGFDPVI
jgi:hypothetical protein